MVIKDLKLDTNLMPGAVGVCVVILLVAVVGIVIAATVK